MARVNQPESQRRDFYLFIDEFHNFSTEAFATILAEARKYRLNLVLAHQYMDQLSLPARQAVSGNIGSLVSFRAGHVDAEVLSQEFGETYAPQTFVGLDRFEIIARMMRDGQTQEPFRARSLLPIPLPRSRREKLITRSREKYAALRAKVERKIGRWLSRADR